MRKEDKKRILAILSLIFVSVVVVIGISYAYWRYITRQNTTNIAGTGCFSMAIKNEVNEISLINQYPITDVEASKLTPFTFTVENTCTINANYTLALEIEDETTLDVDYVKVKLDDEAPVILKNLAKINVENNGKDAYILKNVTRVIPEAKANYELKLWLDYDTPASDVAMNKTFKAKVVVVAMPYNYSPINYGYTNLRDAILAAEYESTPEYAIEQINKKEEVNLNVIATEDEGLNKWEDEYGDSYFYRGNIPNNWVYFAGYYWRVIRINGNGTIRMIYNGKTASQTGASTQDGTSPFNSAYNNATYVGYMYSNTLNTSKELTQSNDNDSPIKRKVETWYDSNIKEKDYGKYVADEPFCNDRTVTSGNGYSGNIYYGAYSRLQSGNSAKKPILTCPNKNDKFMMDKEQGNGMSKAPVGLITADEVALAGGLNGLDNKSYYLYTGNYYWTLSPSYFNGSNADTWYVFNGGYLGNYHNVTSGFGVRPVINLRSDVRIADGNGTAQSPYVIKTY